MKENNNPHFPLICNPNPWNHNPNKIWLASTLKLYRNLEKFNFPGKLTEDKRKQIISLITRDLFSSSELKNPKLLKAEELSLVEKEFLVEHTLSTQGIHQADIGEAFVLDESGEFLALLNLHDHLTLQLVDMREELEKTWDRLVKLEMSLVKSSSYAFSSKFGFLTSDPTQCGTGFVGHIFMHLPGLIYTDHLVESVGKNKDDSIQMTGLHGDPSDLVGDIVAFHNVYTLGLTEENILTSLRTLATKLISEENSVRIRLRQDHSHEVVEVKDKVSRAYGVLLHSYQIEVIEALEAISLLKLGLDVGWISGTTQEMLNQLLFSCRRAHLLCHFVGDKINPEELPHKRSEFVHSALKGVELLI